MAVLTKKRATSTTKRIPEIMRRLLISRLIMPISPARYMAKKGKNIRIPKLLALRTSLTLDETITLNSTLKIMATGTKIRSRIPIFKFGK